MYDESINVKCILTIKPILPRNSIKNQLKLVKLTLFTLSKNRNLFNMQKVKNARVSYNWPLKITLKYKTVSTNFT